MRAPTVSRPASSTPSKPSRPPPRSNGCAAVSLAVARCMPRHTRNKDLRAVEGVQEAIDTARRAGVRLQVSHLLPRPGAQPDALAAIDGPHRPGGRGRAGRRLRHPYPAVRLHQPARWRCRAGSSTAGRSCIREVLRTRRDGDRGPSEHHRQLRDHRVLGRLHRQRAGDAGGRRSQPGRARRGPAAARATSSSTSSPRTPTGSTARCASAGRTPSTRSPRRPRTRAARRARTPPRSARPARSAHHVFHGAYSWAAWYLETIVRERGAFSPSRPRSIA